jgi:DnaK suppressor protein
MSKPLLTAATIKAMPQDAYMSEQQLAFFQHLLLAMQEQIIANVAATEDHLRTNEEAADPADRASQEELDITELRVRDRERKLLKKITSALQRIEEKTYGYCEETGEPIGIARLIARPTATLCIEAQERHERRERQFAG